MSEGLETAFRKWEHLRMFGTPPEDIFHLRPLTGKVPPFYFFPVYFHSVRTLFAFSLYSAT